MSEDYSKSKTVTLYGRQHIHQRGINFDGSVSYDTSSDRVTENFAQDTFNGTRNPRWRDEVRNGNNASTPASGVQHRIIQYEPYNYSVYYTGKIFVTPTSDHSESGYGYPPYGYPTAWTGVSPSVQTDTNNRAIRKFLEEAEKARSSIEFGQDLGEFQETIHGLRHPLDSMRRLVTTTLKSFKKKGLRKGLTKNAVNKAVADTYLEFTFGWNPLAADIVDACNGLRDKSRPKVKVISASASGYDSVGDLESTGAINFNTGARGYTRSFRRAFRGTYIRRIKGGIKTGAVNGSIPIAQMLQLDLEHFAPTVWDLLPYSFIADYFINVGEVINALSFRFGNISWGNDTTLYISDVHYMDIGRTSSSNPSGYTLVSESWSGGNAHLQTRTFSRAPLSSNSLIPGWQVKLPLSGKPWENLSFLALARATNASIASGYKARKLA